jgi:DNA-binding NtrC family response regulator
MIQSVPEYRTRVLVVEMDPMCRRVVERILGNSCNIVTSCDYQEIITLLSAEPFDTLFVDYDFPDPGALALFKAAKKCAPSTRRILMTGENVMNLQHYLDVGLIDACVTRMTSGKIIEEEVTCKSAASSYRE